MRIPWLLWFYIGRRFLTSVVVVLFPTAGGAWLIDVVELLRRSANKPDMTLSIVIQMATFKLPALIDDLIPFIILIAAMITFWRLSRDSELAVVRATGVSVWQFVGPVVVLACLIGLVKIAMFNPLSTALFARYEQLQRIYFGGVSSVVTVSPTGLWLRQSESGTTSIVHARRVLSSDLQLADITVFNFVGQDRFVSRIDAPAGRLAAGSWILDQPQVTTADGVQRRVGELRLPTTMTAERIQETFASAETVSFWDLPGFITLLEQSGFPSTRHRLTFQRHLAAPLFMIAIVLLAAAFSLRAPRRGGAATLLGIGVVVGFTMFLAGNVIAAFGRGGLIPPGLAAWAPPTIWLLLATGVLFHLEDG